MIKGRGTSSSAIAVAIVLSGTCLGQPSGRPIVQDADRYDSSEPLRNIRPIPPRGGELRERPRKMLPNREGSVPKGTDTAVQAPASSPSVPMGLANFEGINNVDGVLPPDTNGDIGPNHYVQIVNLSFAVYSRTGAVLYGPADTNTIWSGFGGACQTSNDGDPIVLYDHLADRWLVSQFALPTFPLGPFYQCIAISQTADPTGAYFRYSFLYSNTKLNDYFKFGVWTDGYYMSANQFNQTTLTWGGQGVVAYDRSRMLLGLSARSVYFDLYTTDPNLGGMLPSHLNGTTLPPAGSPNYFAAVDDDGWGYSGDQIQIWKFQTNWTSPSSSTFTKILPTLGTASFDSNMCGYARNCIPQPGTAQKVDAISDRLMYRLQYRNFGTYETLVSNHTVDATSADRAGIRWFELRKVGAGAWSIYQQSTYSPDTNHRWMGSAAMNGQGDIALGYSVSNASTVSPSIRATGRLALDSLNTMTQGELEIRTGTGSQTHTAARWGDYSAMSVDPTDNCTFWYTQEYYQTTSSAGWQTRVGSFNFGNCGPATPTHDVAVTSVDAPASAFNGTTYTVPVIVQNQGTTSETFTVTLMDSFAATITGSPATVTLLAAGASQTVNFGWTPTADGSHVLTATASTVPGETDIADNTGSDTSEVTTPPPTPTMHVGDLDGAKAPNGNKRWKATVTTTIHDVGHAALGSATVTGSWTTGGTGSCTTSVSGTCSITSASINNTTANTTFAVTNVTKSGYTYLSTANHDPEADSNGTSITVTKP